MRTAILNVADTGPLESLVVMLRSIGWKCYLPSKILKSSLRALSCDTVLDIDDLVKSGSYDQPMELDGEAYPADLERSDVVLFDVKAQRNAKLVWKAFPKLKQCWYRINGGEPEHVIKADGFDCGDERNPPCPVVTPNMWYSWESIVKEVDGGKAVTETPWKGKSYACWPPFYRFEDYNFPRIADNNYNDAKFDSPLCLIHNLQGWGYGALVEPFKKLGIMMFGERSPNGLLHHREVPLRLSKALCMVHLKSSDAPGYALYEALASACPVICTRRLIWRNRMQDLLIPGKTCLVFDRETHEGLSEKDVDNCNREVAEHLAVLSNPVENRRIGEAGRKRLQEVMWSDKKPENVKTFQKFMTKHFGS